MPPVKPTETKQVLETLFDLKLSDAGVHVVFRPTNSLYSFHLLTEENDVGGLGRLSAEGHVRQVGANGRTDEYDPQEVYRMAFSLASTAAKRGWGL